MLSRNASRGRREVHHEEYLHLLVGRQKPARLARELRRFLSQVIPDIGKTGSNLFMSDDIAKGTRWFDTVEQELDRADAGLVCITREALQSGWIHF